jgi:hypothetical protein
MTYDSTKEFTGDDAVNSTFQFWSGVIVAVFAAIPQASADDGNARTGRSIPAMADVTSMECKRQRADKWRAIPNQKWEEVLHVLSQRTPFDPTKSHLGSQVPPFSYHIRVGLSNGQTFVISIYAGDAMLADDRCGDLFKLGKEDSSRLRTLCDVPIHHAKLEADSKH